MMENYNRLTRTSSLVSREEFISERFDYSTADIEASIFFGNSSYEVVPDEKVMETVHGVVRLIDGQLFEVVNLAPPNTTPLQRTSGLFKLAGC
jgi:hypothetical protein